MSAQPTSQALVPAREAIAAIRGADFKQQIAIALPGNVTPDRFVRATVTALMQNPDIAGGDRDSLFQSVIRSAQDGLIPDGREAALVLFGRKVTYMPMIGGYRKIAAEHGWTLRSQVVYEHDHFEHEEGLTPTLVHRPVRPGMDRGKLVAAYAYGIHRDGRRTDPVVLYEEDIAKVRAVSRASRSGPWVEWPERMWEKTAGRRLFERLPLDPADVRVARLLADDPVTAVYGHRPVPGELPPIEGSAAPPQDGAETPATPSAGAPGTGGEEPQQAAGDGDGTDGGPPPAVPGDDTDGTVLDGEIVFEGEEPPPPRSADAPADPGDYELTFGQYKGASIHTIATVGVAIDDKPAEPDPGYVTWLATVMQPKTVPAEAAKAAAQAYLGRLA